MCGINGMVFLKGVKRDKAMMDKIRFVFDQLLFETQDRGEHATGIASFKRDGSYELYKKDINADKMTRLDENYRKIVDNFNGKDSSVIISHTRYYTKGKPDKNFNNHPFDIGNVVGLHNGSVKNDDFLFGKHKENFTRVGEVDSEIIFQLINHHNKENISIKGLKKALEDTWIRGLFALAFVHKNDSNTLHLIKQEKPMYVAFWQEAGIVIFNSDDDYITKAFHTLERVGQSFGLKNAKQDVKIKKIADDRYFSVSANATTLEEAVSEETKIYLESSNYNYKTGGTGTRTTTTSKSTNKYETVTATDSKGLVLQGEIDTATGEVVIWSSDDITDSDDGSGLNETETFEEVICFECNDVMTEEDLTASFNAHNPKDESICMACYTEIMEDYMKEDKTTDKVGEIIDCDGSRVS
jgi:glucosamine 6-phosphate synthetase-like amidotransferase/phosphosugar isomerase protein